MPQWLLILGRLLIYLPTIIKVIPAVVNAVDEVITAIKALAAEQANPKLVRQIKMNELNRAIADARRGDTDGVIALYRLWRRR